MADHALRRDNGMMYLGDKLLLVRYPEGDCDTISALHPNIKDLLSALYDEYQMEDDLKDGDTISLDGTVMAKCEGVDVLLVVG